MVFLQLFTKICVQPGQQQTQNVLEDARCLKQAGSEVRRQLGPILWLCCLQTSARGALHVQVRHLWACHGSTANTVSSLTCLYMYGLTLAQPKFSKGCRQCCQQNCRAHCAMLLHTCCCHEDCRDFHSVSRPYTWLGSRLRSSSSQASLSQASTFRQRFWYCCCLH